MRIYRATSPEERKDWIFNGRLHDSRNKSDKGFFFRREDAIRFGEQVKAYDPLRYFLISALVPDGVALKSREHSAANEGPGIYLTEENLAQLTDVVEEAEID